MAFRDTSQIPIPDDAERRHSETPANGEPAAIQFGIERVFERNVRLGVDYETYPGTVLAFTNGLHAEVEAQSIAGPQIDEIGIQIQEVFACHHLLETLELLDQVQGYIVDHVKKVYPDDTEAASSSLGSINMHPLQIRNSRLSVMGRYIIALKELLSLQSSKVTQHNKEEGSTIIFVEKTLAKMEKTLTDLGFQLSVFQRDGSDEVLAITPIAEAS